MAAVSPWRPRPGDRAIYRSGFAGKFATTATVEISNGTRTITRSAGSWITDGIEVGDRLRVLNTVGSDGVVTAVIVTALVITYSVDDRLGSTAAPESADIDSVEEFEGLVTSFPRGTMTGSATGNVDDILVYGPPLPGQITANSGVPVQWDQDPPLSGPDATNTARPAGPSERARQTRQTPTRLFLVAGGSYSFENRTLGDGLVSGTQGGEWFQEIQRTETMVGIRVDVSHRVGADIRVRAQDILGQQNPATFFDQTISTAPDPGFATIDIPVSGGDKDADAQTRLLQLWVTNGLGGGATNWRIRSLFLLGK